MFQESKKLNFLMQIIKKLIELVNDLQKKLQKTLNDQKEKTNYKFRLVDWIEKNNEGICRIQIIGKNYVIEEKPDIILVNERFILGFSQRDICAIAHLAYLEPNKATLKIVSVDFINNVVTIKNEFGKLIIIPFQKLKKDTDLITQLNALDAFKLGRFIGDADSLISESEKNNL